MAILGVTLIDIQELLQVDAEATYLLIISRSAGGFLGLFVLYRFYNSVNPHVSFTLTLLMAGGLTIALPFLPSMTAMNVVMFGAGASLTVVFYGNCSIFFSVLGTFSNNIYVLERTGAKKVQFSNGSLGFFGGGGSKKEKVY